MNQPPAGYHSVTTRIFVEAPEAQVEFLRAVFNAEGDATAGQPAEVRIGDSLLLISSASERAPIPAFLYIYVEDADATFERAITAGAETIERPLDTPYGDRRATVRDPFGNTFQIAHRLPGR